MITLEKQGRQNYRVLVDGGHIGSVAFRGGWWCSWTNDCLYNPYTMSTRRAAVRRILSANNLSTAGWD